MTIAPMRVLPLLVLALWGLSSCRKQSSEAFHKLDAQQSVLISRDGDDAYVSPEMDQIITGLNAVPENAIEKDRAVALTGKLRAEQRRVREEQAAAAAAAAAPEPVAAPRPLANLSPPEPVEPVAAPPPAVDAGRPSDPWAGMEEKEFLTLFGRCFSSDEAAKTPDGKAAKTFAVRDLSGCERHGQAGATKTLFLFVDGKLWGKRSVTTLNAGAPPAPPPPAPVIDAGAAILTIPGAPLPEGYERVR